MFSIIMRPLLQLILLSIFLMYFGMPALQRFGDEKVMVITSRRDTGGIEAPAITIASKNPDTGIGRRNANLARGYIIQTVCNFSTSQDMENCIIRHTFEQN